MDITHMFLENEQPLDNLISDGGFCGIFRTIGCIGDSLSSGEMEFYDEEGKRRYIDKFEYSWGQYMARTIGNTVYNFSRGGMTAKEYVETFAEENDYWNPKYKCQAYIIALGVNDMGRSNFAETFSEYYSTIVRKLKEIEPDAKLFFMTLLPGKAYGAYKHINLHTKILYDIAEKNTNCYVMDFGKYGPNCDEEFQEKFFLTNHLNPCGYILTAKMVMSYMDYIIRHNMEDFKRVALIGQDMSEVNYG